MIGLRRLSLILTLAATVALAACSAEDDKLVPPTPPSGGPADSSIDPCKLVTPDEVTKALGAKVGDGVAQPGGLPGQRSCAFGSPETKRLVTIGVVGGGRGVYDQVRDGLGAASKEVPGLGDAAVREAGYLHMLKGDTVLMIFVNGLGNGTEAETATSGLAAAALGRLP
ncbi:hypothetical protein F4553_002501 [Allocatelliglobosispora scoriae]|uniref:DUF3558 domain-containing protein n=1 Tax=Allocatelliglobosispora scoriae TaxID=643052 RepID=A0A841BQU4_9ACTN|nr:hypothetical protein [Allocatelliglobosispora scoriae]MBB5869122.1 hypothetical protein [Allocatelliglobosispora scoriae]